MGMIVGMEQCMVDVSKSDFILMIGRQLLFLCMILFVIFFGSLPISFPLGGLVNMVKPKTQVASEKNS